MDESPLLCVARRTASFGADDDVTDDDALLPANHTTAYDVDNLTVETLAMYDSLLV